MSANKVEILLERGSLGLGFNIKGGSDAQLFDGDSGIYVAKIKPDGSAAKDKRLQVGDKILEVNNIRLENVSHQLAVEAFVNAGDVVRIVVIPGEETRVLQFGAQRKTIRSKSSDGWTSSATILGTAVVATGVAAVALWYSRHKNRGGLEQDVLPGGSGDRGSRYRAQSARRGQEASASYRP